MSGEQWIGLDAAVAAVAERMHVNPGPARVRLTDALEECLIRYRGEVVRARGDVGDAARGLPHGDGFEMVNVEIAHVDLANWLALSEAPGEHAQARNVGGRRRVHDRDAFYWKVISIADLDGLPDDPAALTRIMLDWCGTNWSDPPVERTVREWIGNIYAHR